MNPSAVGWIDKFLRDLDDKHIDLLPLDDLYIYLRKNGFIYGNSVAIVIPNSTSIKFSEEERTKINLLSSLFCSYYETIENGSHVDCVKAIIEFYKFLDKKKSFFSFLYGFGANNTSALEKIIHTRIKTNESVLKKNFSHLLTNALLYIDILAFEHFLIYNKDPLAYASALEENLINIIFLALNSKLEKDTYDELLLKLFASSIRYTTMSTKGNGNFDQLDLTMYGDDLEKKYILDLTSLALWNDHEIDAEEHYFIKRLGMKLDVPKNTIQESLIAVKLFVNEHKKEISFFNYSNPAKHFYKQTSKTVSILILRNKKRLIKEISESKDLMILLGQSTVRDLSDIEKQKVKEQLLDICKTIPSLAIFLLPGGGLLLPLLVKFIPKLLPSAFNENKS